MDPRPTDPTDTMTTGQMVRLLADDLARVDAAGAAYANEETRRADLGDPRRETLDVVRAARLEAHQPDLEAAAIAADTAARAADANARRILGQIRDDRLALPPTARSAAAELAPLVEADAPRLPLPRLATELRHAVATGDAAAMWCWSRAIAPRLATRPEGVEHPTDAAARTELARLQSQVRDALRDPTYDPIRTAVDRVLERATATRAAAARGRLALAGPVKTAGGAVKVPWPDQAAR